MTDFTEEARKLFTKLWEMPFTAKEAQCDTIAAALQAVYESAPTPEAGR